MDYFWIMRARGVDTIVFFFKKKEISITILSHFVSVIQSTTVINLPLHRRISKYKFIY
jgi:hypothetical protein